MSKVPFVRFTLALITGILLEIQQPNLVLYPVIFSSLLLVIAFCFFAFKDKISAHKQWILLILLGALFFLGISLTRSQTVFYTNDHFEKHLSDIDYFSGAITSEVEFKKKTIKFTVAVDHIRTKTGWIKASGKVLVYVFKNDALPAYNYGDKIIVFDSPESIESPKNPNELDLKNYYFYHGIGHQQFISHQKIKILGNFPPNRVIEYSIAMRKMAEKIFQRYMHSKREATIASALILGIKGQLDEEILQAYSSTGTMHVLAVSGMHVGIIYKLFQFLLTFILRFKNGKWIQTILLIIILWTYAFVTGLCPSVLRSVAMFTFIILATATNRRSIIFNTMGLSAFLLLCYDPYMIMEIGFQLSYLAVAGIVLMYPSFYDLIDFENKAMDWIWSILCVSLAAQIATFPIGIYYFHQFPSYFLLSNLVVIPSAVGIMIIGLLFVAISPWQSAGEFLGKWVEKSVFYLNKFILWMEQFPFATLEGISITVLETWLIYACITSIILLIYSRKIVAFYGFISLVGVISLLQVLEIVQQKHQQRLIVYQLYKASCIDLINGQKAATLSNIKVLQNKSIIGFHIQNHRWKLGIKNIDTNPEFTRTDIGIVLVWNQKRILIIDRKVSFESITSPLTFDLIIVQNNAAISLESIYNHFIYSTLVFDGSNTLSKIKSETSSNLNAVHFTEKQGAFILDM